MRRSLVRSGWTFRRCLPAEGALTSLSWTCAGLMNMQELKKLVSGLGLVQRLCRRRCARFRGTALLSTHLTAWRRKQAAAAAAAAAAARWRKANTSCTFLWITHQPWEELWLRHIPTTHTDTQVRIQLVIFMGSLWELERTCPRWRARSYTGHPVGPAKCVAFLLKSKSWKISLGLYKCICTVCVS